ncbi:L-lactate dehydrogenase complex protein LldG [Hymenobacter daecheongensis DSM 21074]|uniref:L-lactate dehydrogenase complex protein LldG n=1 Tax=Hymenobacter daecheongensis DSM 21074 TaxID=1121955 RepID=A0A1M6CU79_9BACT|nr:LUD domain-containing protein [Hymenobacter daecheongensis]SHI64572.1 L-lactate dehydrogenase complex protein LldG [Hymenobacter daecheongensis DSM 21074]
MAESSRDLVLRRIREALRQPAPQPAAPDFAGPVFAPATDELAVAFAESFVRSGGVFYYCTSEEHFYDQLFTYKKEKSLDSLYVWEPELKKLLHAGGIGFVSDETGWLDHADAGLTTCEALVARTGSVLVSAASASGRRLSIYPDQHLVLARTSQIVADIGDGLRTVQQRYGDKLPSMISLTTGPSRTADIEKTLVLGAHGPRSIVLFLLDDEDALEATA